MFFPNNNLSRFFIIVGAAAFFLVGFLGVIHFGMGGMMPGCPLMVGTGLCDMAPLEHLSIWQSMFTAISTTESVAFVIVALAFVAAFLTARFRRIGPLPENLSALFGVFYHREISPVPVLVRVFSDGILNSKRF